MTTYQYDNVGPVDISPMTMIYCTYNYTCWVFMSQLKTRGPNIVITLILYDSEGVGGMGMT